MTPARPGLRPIAARRAPAGTNSAIYTGPSKNYALVFEADNSTFTVQDKVGVESFDTLSNIQQVQFLDRSLDTSWFPKTASLPEAQLLELTDLYIASFNRAPDSLGLNYWGSQLKDGMSLPDIARGFFRQPEMADTYASGQTSQDFFTKVYENVLGRAPDTAGLAYWTDQLDTHHISRDVSVLSVISGARGTPDAQYLLNKEAVGTHFALTQGLNNIIWARTVMEQVQRDEAGAALGESLTDVFAHSAGSATQSEMVIKILGIVA